MNNNLSVPKPFYNLTPRIVNTIFLLAFQQYFLQHPEYRFDYDDSKTMMDIAADYDEEDYKQKSLPVLIVMNGPASIEPAGIGTGMSHIAPRKLLQDGDLIIKNGVWDSVHQFNVNSSVSIRITAPNKDDIDELSFEVGMFLSMLKYTLANVLQLQNLSTVSVTTGQQTNQQGWTGRYTAVVSMGYSYTISRRFYPVDTGKLIADLGVKMEAYSVNKDNPINSVTKISEKNED